MKIAYFVNQYPKVSHTFIRREILALERLGIEVFRFALLGWAESLPDPEDLQEQAKTRYVLREGAWGLIVPMLRVLLASPMRLFGALGMALRVSRRSDRRLLRHLVRVAEACRVVLWLREAQVSAVHAHFGTNSAEVAMYTRCLGGPPFSFTVHGPEEFESQMALAEKIGMAHFVAAISSFCRSQIYFRCKTVEWPKVHVVRCGIEPVFYGSAPPLTAQDRRLVCVGRLCEGKGQLLLVEAMACLKARGVEVELVLAGDGPLRTEIEAAIKRHGLESSVRITGWISNTSVRDEILAARALVLPSFSEGLPVVIMEAMTLRRPVLSTYIAGIPELVRPGETGWLFAAGSLTELVAAIEDCLSRPAEDLRRMSELGYDRVVEFHSIDAEASKLAALFRSSAITR